MLAWVRGDVFEYGIIALKDKKKPTLETIFEVVFELGKLQSDTVTYVLGRELISRE